MGVGNQTNQHMKSQIYSLIEIALGVLGFVNGLHLKNDQGLAAILVIGGIFLFGCGLVAGAIGAKR